MWRALLALLACCGFEGRGRSAATIDAPVIEIDAPAGPDAPSQSWWDPMFKRRRLIEVDGTKLAMAVTQIPVLVTLTNHTGIAANGADIRFASYENTGTYDHEIDRYDAGGTSSIWVRIPALPAQQFRFWMYYGNTAASSTSSGAAVFASTFVSVHHLDDFQDATGHGHNASPLPTNTPAIATGRIAQGRDFDGTNDFIELANEAAFDFTTTLYASAWVRISGFDLPAQAIITKGDYTWRMQRAGNSQNAQFGTNTSENLDGGTMIDDDQWHLVAINYTGTQKQLYVDGTLDSMTTYMATLDNRVTTVRFGMNPDSTVGGQRWWNGLMDEVRISGQSRTAAWAKAEYLSVADPAFVTIGTEEMYPP